MRLKLFLFALVLVSVCIVSISITTVPAALPARRTPADIFENPDAVVGLGVPCETIVKVSQVESVGFNGLPFHGNTVELDASAVKIYAQVPKLTQSPSPGCDDFTSGLSEGGAAWELLARPAGSAATIENVDSLTPTLLLDMPGEYEVEFTACGGDSCQLWLNNIIRAVSPESTTFAIEVKDEFAIPPETAPVVPSQETAEKTEFPRKDDLCDGGGWFGVMKPAWRAVAFRGDDGEEWRFWHGPDDYESVEGQVAESKTATGDSILNHDRMDAIFYVDADPPFQRLLPAAGRQLAGQERLEVEWEYQHFDPGARPTRGDRVSATGYWIHDCDHRAKTEIHPPVMVASHRARPVVVPVSEGYGANIYVPGVVSTVYINRDAGEGTRTCGSSGLSQSLLWSGGIVVSDCLPQSEGYSSETGNPGNPIDTTYTYNIYLPRNPRDIYAEYGRTVPRAKLFFKIYHPYGAGGPEPVVTEMNEGDLTYLQVQIDLRGYGERTYGRRIEAGWIYPSPDNWGIRRWRLSVNSVRVYDDLDLESDGDWGMWVNTNNAAQEWTMVFDEDCHDCIQSGVENFGGAPWTTGNAGSSHSLGPDLLLFPFPDQRIWVHSGGFDKDTLGNHGIGQVNCLLLPQPEPDPYCGLSDTGTYKLNFEISAGPPVAPPALSFLGQLTYEQYVLRADPNLPTQMPGQRLAQDWNHPAGLPMPLGAPPLRFADTDYFERQEPELLSLYEISTSEFRRRITDAQRERPDDVAVLLRELRARIDLLTGSPRDPELFRVTTVLREALPTDLWEQHFGDIEVEDPSNRPVTVPLWSLILAVLLAGVVSVLLSRLVWRP